MEKYIELYGSDGFVDFLPFMNRIGCRCMNIYGPHNSGKSTCLSAIRSYYSDKYDYKNVFGGSKNVREDELNRWPVLFEDFSDFCEKTWGRALAYFKKAVSDLYISQLERCLEGLWSTDSLERYLDTIEGKLDEEKLSRSLLNLVYDIRRCAKESYVRSRPLILIDDVSRPIFYAAKYGFYKELMSFYDRFFDIDHYELTYGIVTTSFAPANVDASYYLKYITDEPVNRFEPFFSVSTKNGVELSPINIEQWIQTHEFFYERLDFEKSFNEMRIPDGGQELKCMEISLDTDLQGYIDQKRKWIKEQRILIKKAERERQKRIKKEYAAPLCDAVNINSSFAGVRRFEIQEYDRDTYDSLNRMLTELWDEYGKDIKQRDVYRYIQRINTEKSKKIPGVDLEMLKSYADSKGDNYRVSIDSDQYWSRFDYAKKERDYGHSDLALIKVYLSLKNIKKAAEVFEDVVKYLCDKAGHLFHAKFTSEICRNDPICLWVAVEDFPGLERHTKRYENILCASLPFVAYRGCLGISRELYTWSSHNGVQADLISTYLKGVESRDEIDVIEMYDLYTRAWNGDLPDKHLMSAGFKNSDAQEFIILLTTIELILRKRQVDDDSILLSGDDDLWHALGRSRNWYQLGENWSKGI